MGQIAKKELQTFYNEMVQEASLNSDGNVWCEGNGWSAGKLNPYKWHINSVDLNMRVGGSSVEHTSNFLQCAGRMASNFNNTAQLYSDPPPPPQNEANESISSSSTNPHVTRLWMNYERMNDVTMKMEPWKRLTWECVSDYSHSGSDATEVTLAVVNLIFYTWPAREDQV